MPADFEHLLLSIAQGDESALEELYQNFHYAVYSLALTILHSSSLADDVTQDVFLKIWSSARSYRAGANPKAWIMRICRNAAIDVYRKNKREISVEEVFETAETSAFEEQVSDRLTLERVLEHLNENERQIVILRAISGLTVAEVSRITQTPLNTVYWKYHRALKTLRQYL